MTRVAFDFIAALAHHVLDLHLQIHDAVASQLKLIAGGEGSVLLACATAFSLGMVHALTPGHGKAILFAYFLGRKARPWAGVAAAAQVAGLHVGTATVLVVAIGAASYAFGRPTGGAFVLQCFSAVAVTAMGAWYLWRSLRGPDLTAASSAHDHSNLALAVGLLPCPLDRVAGLKTDTSDLEMIRFIAKPSPPEMAGERGIADRSSNLDKSGQ